MNVDELIERARSASGIGIKYGLGKGGMRPNSPTPDSSGKCDCSGYVSWCMGVSRHTADPFYVNENGGWIETTAVHKDALSPTGFFYQLDEAEVGCIVVYGDHAGRQGHIGIVTSVRKIGGVSVPKKVIHCSVSNSNAGDAVRETTPTAFTNNPNSIYAWYEGIFRTSNAESVDLAPNILPLDVESGFSDWPTPSVITTFRSKGIPINIWGASTEPDRMALSGMSINADGAPNAYHPNDNGIDYLRNAGAPPGNNKNAPHKKWNWWGIAVDSNNNPYRQKQTDPNPGYYVSTTALIDPSKSESDPKRYVNSNDIPFIVVPGGEDATKFLGDFAYIINLENGNSSPAIVADIGPKDHFGEGSVQLAKRLDVRSSPKNGGTRKHNLLYIVFAGSGNRKARPLSSIEKSGNQLFTEWGGIERVEHLVPLIAPSSVNTTDAPLLASPESELAALPLAETATAPEPVGFTSKQEKIAARFIWNFHTKKVVKESVGAPSLPGFPGKVIKLRMDQTILLGLGNNSSSYISQITGVAASALLNISINNEGLSVKSESSTASAKAAIAATLADGSKSVADLGATLSKHLS